MGAQLDLQVAHGLFKVNALLPGASYEFAIGNTSTINTDLVIGIAIQGGSNKATEFGFFPAIQAEYRKYVNFNRRISKNKNISGNSGNYVGLVNQLQLGKPLVGTLENDSDYYYNLAAVYGIQRTQPKGFYWGVAFGPGVFLHQFNTSFGLLVNIKLGWVIGGRKK